MPQIRGKQLADASIIEAKLADGAVTTNKIANDAIDSTKLGDDSVTEFKLADGAVTEFKVSDNAITETKIADAAITEGKLGSASVTNDKIADGTIQGAKLAAGAVGETQLADASITQAKLNLVDPTSAAEAATKGYVDGLVNGLTWKAPVVAVNNGFTGSPIDVAVGGVAYIDGETINVPGTRVLLIEQGGDGTTNGIWEMQSGPWTRPSDFADGSDAVNVAVFASNGSTYADTQWVQTGNPPRIVGTNALNFVQFGAGSSYTAGNGLDLVGTEFSVDPATNGSISVASGEVVAHGLATSTYNAQIPNFPTSGNDYDTGLTVISTPTGSGVFHVFVNGVRVVVGNGSKTEDCYFTGDAGVSARSWGAIADGDAFYWNTTIAGYDLDVNDRVTFLYLDNP